MTEDDAGPSKERTTPDTLSSQRVFKKSAPNNKLTLYLSSRDLVISDDQIDKLQGVVVVDPEYLQDRKVFGQVTLTFRYGREDEEVMGLKFCNEAVMCLAQLYPIHERATPEPTTPLQDALVRRLGPNARPFTMEVTPLAPPSVQLVPAKEYNGAPIGTSYDVRAYVAERADEKLHRRSTVRMGIRVVQRAAAPPAPSSSGGGETIPRPVTLLGSIVPPPPHAAVDKPFLLSEGRVELEASLDRAIYCHGDPVLVNVAIHNSSSKTVRKIKVFVVQYVDVCMFSNGKFKNVVALVNNREECPLAAGSSLNKTYTLHPEKGVTKNWIALEDSFNKAGTSLASTVTCSSDTPEERNVFAIYVSYYVKVKILVGAMGGVLALKLPFTLMHSSHEPDFSFLPLSQAPLEISPTESKQEISTPPSTSTQNDQERKKKTVTKEEEDLIVKCEPEPS
ncbi:phosrestin-2 [Anabrus simplex]|uniref:phosrestin-2 n=1 Tax=Anabrus simplex TaxID=316456 RepID=UPI0034DCE899